jgi:hypothetical protein
MSTTGNADRALDMFAKQLLGVTDQVSLNDPLQPY